MVEGEPRGGLYVNAKILPVLFGGIHLFFDWVLWSTEEKFLMRLDARLVKSSARRTRRTGFFEAQPPNKKYASAAHAMWAVLLFL